MKNKIIIGLSVVFGFYVAFSGSGSFDEYKDKTLTEFKALTTPTRHDIMEEYVSEKDLPDEAVDGIYACVSQMLFTKSADLKLDDISSWCLTDYENQKIDAYINFDNFEKGFSPWDGSYRELESRIKNAMNNSDSYEHVQTRYRLELNNNPRAVVTTQFKGENAYGAIVKQQISAGVDIQSGEIMELMQ